jgi:hypothetical protein
LSHDVAPEAKALLCSGRLAVGHSMLVAMQFSDKATRPQDVGSPIKPLHPLASLQSPTNKQQVLMSASLHASEYSKLLWLPEHP